MTAKPKATSSTDLPNNLREHNTASLDLEMNVIEGEIPSDCEGHAFWLVPTPQNGATPWFNGYGQLYRLDFKSGGIHLKSEQFRTPSVICDQKINEQPWWTYLTNLRKLLFGRLFRFRNLGGLARLSPRLGVQNQCNTAIQAFQDPENNSWRMFATIDSGRPFEFDLTTLKPVTPVGDRSEWIPLEINDINKVSITIYKFLTVIFQKYILYWLCMYNSSPLILKLFFTMKDNFIELFF
ncbi:MAG: carotenoid oxygenase family protein, partial [Moorea sp. SIO3G5]|nr:carotenoid oxygenase family protein [Moorena sp. SIO3G5]